MPKNQKGEVVLLFLLITALAAGGVGYGAANASRSLKEERAWTNAEKDLQALLKDDEVHATKRNADKSLAAKQAPIEKKTEGRGLASTKYVFCKEAGQRPVRQTCVSRKTGRLLFPQISKKN